MPPDPRCASAGYRITRSSDTSGCCSRHRAGTAPASTAPSSPSRRRSSATARRSTCASRSCTTCTSCRARAAGRDLRRRGRRGPEGAHVVFSAHGVSPAVVQAAADRGLPRDRRDLPARHQGAPRGRAVRPRRLRDPADRPRRPRGGRGHDGRGARAHHPRRTARTRPTPSRCATPTSWCGCRRPRSRVDETMETVRRLRERFPNLAGSARATTSATPPRTGRSRSRRWPRQPNSCIVVGSANTSNSVRLVEVALEHGARAALPRRLRERDPPGVARRRRDGRRHQRRVACPRCSCRRCSTTSPTPATAPWSEVRTAEEDLMFSLPRELRQRRVRAPATRARSAAAA